MAGTCIPSLSKAPATSMVVDSAPRTKGMIGLSDGTERSDPRRVAKFHTCALLHCPSRLDTDNDASEAAMQGRGREVE